MYPNRYGLPERTLLPATMRGHGHIESKLIQGSEGRATPQSESSGGHPSHPSRCDSRRRARFEVGTRSATADSEEPTHSESSWFSAAGMVCLLRRSRSNRRHGAARHAYRAPPPAAAAIGTTMSGPLSAGRSRSRCRPGPARPIRAPAAIAPRAGPPASAAAAARATALRGASADQPGRSTGRTLYGLDRAGSGPDQA